MNWQKQDLEEANLELKGYKPIEIVQWVLSKDENAVVTTNFRPYESAILHLVASLKPEVKVIWCDTGYNTLKTYKCAQLIINQLDLNVHVYVPRQTKAYRDSICLLYTSPSPRDRTRSRMPSSA